MGQEQEKEGRNGEGIVDAAEQRRLQGSADDPMSDNRYSGTSTLVPPMRASKPPRRIQPDGPHDLLAPHAGMIDVESMTMLQQKV